MSGPLPPGSTIGILGGGQLGRMLAMAAARLGYHVAIFEPQAECPAAQVASRHVAAAWDDDAALAAFAAACDVVTCEFENVPVAAATAIDARTPVRPLPAALAVAQDRIAEKTFLNEAGIATAAFAAVDGDADIAEALAAFGGSGVLKTRRLGYDGKGQRRFRDAGPGEWEGAFAALGGVPLVLERLIPFEAELSVVAARAVDGTMAAYEPARNIHRDGILRSSTVPAGLPGRVEEEARAIAFAILAALDYVGVIGVEFFHVGGEGGLLVNEIAPRVHNSGHWTEAVCTTSQFEQHIRAVAGLPLGDTRRLADCTMENLIGAEVERAAALVTEPGIMLHLYGKAETRPGRKMGHFTRLAGR